MLCRLQNVKNVLQRLLSGSRSSDVVQMRLVTARVREMRMNPAADIPKACGATDGSGSRSGELQGYAKPQRLGPMEVHGCTD